MKKRQREMRENKQVIELKRYKLCNCKEWREILSIESGCVCERERGRETGRQTDRARERERE